MYTHLEVLSKALDSAFNLPPGCRARDIDRNVTSTDDASGDELWDACTPEQQTEIIDAYTLDSGNDIVNDIAHGSATMSGLTRAWDEYRDRQLDRLVQDGQLSI